MISLVCTLIGLALLAGGLGVLFVREVHLWHVNRQASQRLHMRRCEDELARRLRDNASQARTVTRTRW